MDVKKKKKPESQNSSVLITMSANNILPIQRTNDTLKQSNVKSAGENNDISCKF